MAKIKVRGGTITTNWHLYPLLDLSDLTPKEQKEFEDYREPDSHDYVRYHGMVYNLSDIERSNVPDWDGQVVDTFFSAVLFRFPRAETPYGYTDYEHVICGTFIAGDSSA